MKTENQTESSDLCSDQAILEKLRQLSLKEKIMRQDRHNHQHQALAMASQYQLNYRPMPKGIRLRVWEEGWKYRNIRKKSGFKHTKLEWKLPSQPGSHSSSGSTVEGSTSSTKSDLESLNLPPTKLEKKRQRLHRMYHRKLGGKESTHIRPHTSHHEQRTDPNEGLEVMRRASMNQIASEVVSLNSYDRNKQKNLKSQIVMPSYTPSLTSSRISSPKRQNGKEAAYENGSRPHSKDKRKHRRSKRETESNKEWSSKSTKGTDETPILEASEKSETTSKKYAPVERQEKKSSRKSSAKSSSSSNE